MSQTLTNNKSLAEAVTNKYPTPEGPDIYLKGVQNNIAIQTYFEIKKLSCKFVLPPRDQVVIARLLEKEGDALESAEAYKRLINTYPSANETMKAIVSYGNLCLDRINEPKEALEVFKRGRELCALNPEWQGIMEEGLKKAKARMDVIFSK